MPRTGMICWDCNIFASASADYAKLMGYLTTDSLDSIVNRFVCSTYLLSNFTIRITAQIKGQNTLLQRRQFTIQSSKPFFFFFSANK